MPGIAFERNLTYSLPGVVPGEAVGRPFEKRDGFFVSPKRRAGVLRNPGPVSILVRDAAACSARVPSLGGQRGDLHRG